MNEHWIFSPVISEARGPELAAEILSAIRSDPAQHSQNIWGERTHSCGTTMCVAGWAAYLTGHAHYEGLRHPNDEEMLLLLGTTDYDFVGLGAELLGIDEDDASKLFYYYNDQGALRAMEHIAAGEPIPWKDIFDEFPELGDEEYDEEDDYED